MEKTFDLVYPNWIMCAVDKDADLLEGGYWLHPQGVIFPYTEVYKKAFDALKKVGKSNVLIASQDPSFKLPLLPSIEETDQDLADKAFKFFKNDVRTKGIVLAAWVRGYRAAQAKRYTEEDIKAIAHDSYLFAGLQQIGESWIDWFNRRIQNLNPKPKQVVIEMEYPTREEVKQSFEFERDDIRTLAVELKPVMENGFVKVIRWIYE